LSDVPLISNWLSAKADNLILDIKNNSHIKRAIFVYLINKEFVKKFDEVTHAQKELHINHDVIKKHALLNKPYGKYLFSYERIKD
jgi:NUMOD1 domain